ncbi:MAG: hypothetical protein PHU54_09320 [Candidatus Omnitrophica bacterium]|nr:hypothetical protein [Candidatus Omnitrophota bacterium]
MVKCILARLTNIEGHTVDLYYAKNMNGKSMFTFGKSTAHVFENEFYAYMEAAHLHRTLGYAQENMRVFEATEECGKMQVVI